MSAYNDDVFGDCCFDNYQDGYEGSFIKDNSINNIKIKGKGKTNIKKDAEIHSKIVLPESSKVKLTKDEILDAQIIKKKKKKDRAIELSKIDVAYREKLAMELKLKEETESANANNVLKKQIDCEDDDDWETKFL
jgi:hypothetical protein